MKVVRKYRCHPVYIVLCRHWLGHYSRCQLYNNLFTVMVRIEYLHIFTTLSLVFTALEIISYFSLAPSRTFEYTNQEYTFAEPDFVKV